jgi:Immunity protein 50
MEWYNLAMNPHAISELYTDVPSLQAIPLEEVVLSNNGPTMITLKMNLPRFPDNAPPRWKFKGYTSIQLQLDFWEPEVVEVSHRSGDHYANIGINLTSEKRIYLNVTSSSWNILAYALAFRITLRKNTSPLTKG